VQAAGLEVTRDMQTTTDFAALADSGYDLADAISVGEIEGAFSLELCYDADDQSSVEIVCDNCRGLGHPKRLCPSPKRFRTFQYAVAVVQGAHKRAEERAAQDGAPRGGRRPPPRGQRPPFRNQPRRFQPRQPRARSAVDDDDNDEPAPAQTVEKGHLSAEPMPTHESAGMIGPKPEDDQAAAARSTAQTQAASPATAPVLQPMVLQNDDELFDDEVEQSRSAVDRVTVLSGEVAGSASVSLRSSGDSDPEPNGSSKPLLAASLLVLLISALWEIAAAPAKLAERALRWAGAAGVILVLICARHHTRGAVLEKCFEGHTIGSVNTGALSFCVDSGATSTCISLARLHDIQHGKLSNLSYQLDQLSPRLQMQVASDAVLKVTHIITLNVGNVRGFRITTDGKREPCTTSLRLRRTLVVDGLGENVMLISVRKAKLLDGIYTYTNPDNPHGVDDCIRTPDGVFVPFGAGGNS
jgi:hypothetical protein